jgi:uncharacterized membrane protein
MWISPQSPIQKIAIVIYGLVAGVLTAMGTSAVCLVLGISISLFAQSTGWIHLGEYQPWLPIIGLEYGFIPGVAIGAFVCWRVWRTRLER